MILIEPAAQYLSIHKPGKIVEDRNPDIYIEYLNTLIFLIDADANVADNMVPWSQQAFKWIIHATVGDLGGSPSVTGISVFLRTRH